MAMKNDDDKTLLHVRRGNLVFFASNESPTFFAGKNYKSGILRHIRLLFKVKTMNTGH